MSNAVAPKWFARRIEICSWHKTDSWRSRGNLRFTPVFGLDRDCLELISPAGQLVSWIAMHDLRVSAHQASVFLQFSEIEFACEPFSEPFHGSLVAIHLLWASKSTLDIHIEGPVWFNATEA
jgi:hypothetical protein